MTFNFTKRNFSKIKTGKIGITSEWSVIFHEYKPRRMMFTLYQSIFMIRRLIYAMILVFMREYLFLQTSAIILLFTSLWAYQLIFRPFKVELYNVFMGINESAMVFLPWMFYPFTDVNVTESVSIRMGWAILGAIAVIIILNMGVLWIMKSIYWLRDMKKIKKHPKMVSIY